MAKSKSYKMFRVPEDVWESWLTRKNKIQERVNTLKLNKKKKRVTMTNVLRYYGNRKIDIWDEDLVSFYKRSKKKNKFRGALI